MLDAVSAPSAQTGNAQTEGDHTAPRRLDPLWPADPPAAAAASGPASASAPSRPSTAVTTRGRTTPTAAQRAAAGLPMALHSSLHPPPGPSAADTKRQGSSLPSPTAEHDPALPDLGGSGARISQRSHGYTRQRRYILIGVAKHLVDLDEDALGAARAELGTVTIKDTVNEALRRATSRRDRQVAAALDVLADAHLEDRSDAWR